MELPRSRAGARARPTLALLVLLGGLATVLPTQAADEEPGRRVSFQVERSREVENDHVTAVLSVTAEDADPATLADGVNQTLRWALERASAAEGIQVRTGGYRTFPITQDGRIRRWRASQEIVLESGSSDAISTLVGALQSRLQLGSIAFSVSPERRRETEDALIDESLAAFQARADRIRRGLGAAAWEIVQLDVHTQGAPPPQPLRGAVMRAASAEVAPPALEGGRSRVSVGVRANIALR